MVVRSGPYVEIESVMSKAAYEIRAAGEVPQRTVEDFEGVTVSIDPAGSTIRAELADEARLQGVLAALRREGYVLLELRRVLDYGPGACLGPETLPGDPPTGA